LSERSEWRIKPKLAPSIPPLNGEGMLVIVLASLEQANDHHVFQLPAALLPTFVAGGKSRSL